MQLSTKRQGQVQRVDRMKRGGVSAPTRKQPVREVRHIKRDPKTGLFPLLPKRTKWIPLKRDPRPRVPPEHYVQERTVLVTSLAGRCIRLWPNDLAFEILIVALQQLHPMMHLI